MPEYRENELCYEDYRALRTLAGWETHSEEQTRRALAAALYDVTAVEDGRAVAMGRLVGTGCTTSSRTRSEEHTSEPVTSRSRMPSSA